MCGHNNRGKQSCLPKNIYSKSHSKNRISMDATPSFISLIDEYNTPLLVHVNVKEKDDVNRVLKYNVFSNISLDYFESQLFQWTSLESHSEVKLLFQLEGVTVYGCLVKSTGLKIIVGFEQEETIEEDIVALLFTKIKKVYLRVKLNPFISALKDDNRRKELVNKLNEKFEEEF